MKLDNPLKKKAHKISSLAEELGFLSTSPKQEKDIKKSDKTKSELSS